MKGLLKHFALITLLIIHSSWGSVMAAHMLSANLSTGAPNSSISEVQAQESIVSIDTNSENSSSKPCPNHANIMMQASTDDSSQNQSTLHDCSNCDCANVVSSISPLLTSLVNVPREHSHSVAMLSTTFPDSPLSAILRPPIS